ncbi:MAG: endonuclease [Chthoniobacterales bacterium]
MKIHLPKNLGDVIYSIRYRTKLSQKILQTQPEGAEWIIEGLAIVRYNRLIDIFLGIASYSLQNHLRTTVTNLGQVEIDEIYVGVDKKGVHYIIPIQAKGGSDQLSAVQAKQDIACCMEKFPDLVCRALSVQFIEDNLIALFELCLEDSMIKVIDEKHYRLVAADNISTTELIKYKTMSGL